MTSYAENEAWYEKYDIFRMFRWSFWTTAIIIFIWKTIPNCLKRQLSSTITNNQQNDVHQWRHMSHTGHSMKMKFSKIFLLSCKTTLYQDQVSVLRHQLSGKVSEKWQNDVSKWRHTSERGHDIEKITFPKCLPDDDDKL